MSPVNYMDYVASAVECKGIEENHRNYYITSTFKHGIMTEIHGFIPGGSGSIPGAGNFRVMKQEF
jgi:hypothetical protein